MRGIAHAALTAAIVFPVVNLVTRDAPLTLGLTAGVALASLLPDLDHPASSAAGVLHVRGLSEAWMARQRHRSGWTHSLLACLLWPVVAAGVAWIWLPLAACLWLAGILAAGGLFHVLEDWIPLGSKSGVPLFWPVSRRQWKLGRSRRLRALRTAPAPAPAPTPPPARP